MAVSDILAQYANTLQGSARDDARNDFGAVAPLAPPEILQAALVEAFRAGEPFPEIVMKLFSRANSEQRAALVRRLIELAGQGEEVEAVLANVPGGLPERSYQITGRDAEKVKAAQVRALAAAAEQHDPETVKTISELLVGHPDLVKTLEPALLTVALREIAARVRR